MSSAGPPAPSARPGRAVVLAVVLALLVGAAVVVGLLSRPAERLVDESQVRNYMNAAMDANATDPSAYVRSLVATASDPQYPGGPTYRADVEADARLVCRLLSTGEAPDARTAADRIFAEKYNGATPLPIAYRHAELAAEILCPAP